MAKAQITAAPIKLEMTFSKETKHTWVFANDAPDAAVTSLYVRRTVMKEKRPSVTVTIE